MKKEIFDDTGLKLYRAKRDFEQTKEPKPRVENSKATRKLMFVIQKHDASRLHYDFRLEMEGVLKSWAVPKGLPLQRGERHLAIHVEDHPMAYSNFEGTIPEGNYGGGTVMVWDTGTYEAIGTEPLKGLKAGKLHVQLAGKKLQGEWALIRLKPRPGEKESWLVFKGGEDFKLAEKRDDESVLSGRSMKRIATDNDSQWGTGRKSAHVKSATRFTKAVSRSAAKSPQKKTLETALVRSPDAKVEFVSPMKCRLMKAPPHGVSWIYEIKFDGFRVVALKRGNEVELLSRSRKDLTQRFPGVAQALQKLPFKSGVIDGEVVALDAEGRSSFQLLQMANLPGSAHPPLCFYAFDLLNLDNRSLVNLPLAKRKEILEPLVSGIDERVRYSANITGDPVKLLGEIRKLRLEGIIAKRIDSKYEAGLRTGSWVKIKIVNEQEFVIGGYTAPKGSRDRFGALLVGYYEKGELRFASKVGTGFNRATLESLYQNFEKIKRNECPFANLPEKKSRRYRQSMTVAEMKRCSWLKPQLVCQINFTEWTRDGHLRHPVFLGLRDDKKPGEVVREY
ncbi:MAG: non-homologous end-joining DNA ligase [Verrucomicrobiota bacterium]